MPGINFLEYAREEDIVHGVALFGICDRPGEHPAFISYDPNTDEWIAEVKNSQRKNIQFLPVDKHIPLFRQDGTELKRCDAMLLTYRLQAKDIIIFVELKDVKRSQVSDARNYAVDQLRETIEAFSEGQDLSSYKKSYAYAVNRIHPFANRANTKDIYEFRKEYKVTLRFTREIIFS